MNKRDIAKVLTDIIAATPSTPELNPLLYALAKVADELIDQYNLEEVFEGE